MIVVDENSYSFIDACYFVIFATGHYVVHWVLIYIMCLMICDFD